MLIESVVLLPLDFFNFGQSVGNRNMKADSVTAVYQCYVKLSDCKE